MKCMYILDKEGCSNIFSSMGFSLYLYMRLLTNYYKMQMIEILMQMIEILMHIINMTLQTASRSFLTGYIKMHVRKKPIYLFHAQVPNFTSTVTRYPLQIPACVM